MTRLAARRARGEEGASLIIALAFMLVFALLVTALLQFSVTSFKAANVVVDRARASYSADAGVDTAVARIKRDANMQIGRDGQTCDTVTFTGADSTTPSATATCTAQTNSGAVRAGMDGYPANSVLTTTGGITLNGSGKLKSNANVYSDGGITLNNGATLDAYDNAVTARGACTPTVPGAQWVTVKTQCNVPVTAPQYADGNPSTYSSYTSQLSGAFPPKSLNNGPTCTNGIATFSPGYWTDSKKLTNLPGGCRAGVFYFQPGVYYFNLSSRSGDVWHINGIVVGGTPLGSWYSSGTQPPTPGPNATQPVACNPAQSGVQFVFGNDTQIYLDPPTSTSVSSLELCPSTDSQGNRIAMYGALTCDTCNSDPIVGVLNPSNSGSNGLGDYADNVADGCTQGGYANNLTAYCVLAQPPPPTAGPTSSGIDGKVATSTSTKKSAVERFDGFDWSANSLGIPSDSQPQFPAGLMIQSIKVIVRHREPSSTETPTITVTALTKGGGAVKTCKAAPQIGTNAGTWYYDGKTLAFEKSPPPAWTPPGTDQDPHPTGLDCTGALIGATTSTKGGGQDFAKSLTVDYAVDKTGANFNSSTQPQLDGLQVVVTLVTQVVPQGGCVTGDTANGFLTPCSFLVNSAGAAGHAGIWGTMYTPNAFLGTSGASFDFGGSSNIVFNMGVILSSMDLTGLPTNDATGRFRLGNGSGRTVVITSTSGNQKVRALVRVVDSATASPHGFLAVIRQWSTRK
jgi:Tfp pilus assembly protein PilX